MPTLPTLRRRVAIYLGWKEQGIGLKPDFPVDRSLILLAGDETRSTISWHERRLSHLKWVLGRVEADGRRLRRNGNGNHHDNGHAHI